MTFAIAAFFAVSQPSGWTQDARPATTATSTESAEEVRKKFDETGDADAAKWLLGKNYVGRKLNTLSEVERADFGKLLATVYDASPDDAGMQQLYVDYLITSEQFQKAIPVLLKMMRADTMRGLQAAAILQKIGEDDKARAVAEKTLQLFSKQLEDNPTNIDLQFAVARNQVFLQQHSEAVETLQSSITKAKSRTNQARIGQAIGDTYVAWIAHEKSTTEPGPEQEQKVWQLLGESLRIAPGNTHVLGALLCQITTMAEQDDQAKLREQLRPLDELPEGVPDFVKASLAVLSQPPEKASPWVDRALEKLPGSLELFNNLAVTVSIQPGDEAVQVKNNELGLKLANVAIGKSPEAVPTFYDTRGQILFRLKRYQDAIPDLEKSLKSLTPQPAARKMLAECRRLLDEEGR